MLFTIDQDLTNQRLDKALSVLLPNISRSKLKKHIEDGLVLVNNSKIIVPKHKLLEGDELLVDEIVYTTTNTSLSAKDIAVEVVYEDEHMIVVNKPAGIVTHPGAGGEGNTLANFLLHHCPAIRNIGEPDRPGIVHRLDKDTTGLMLAAKSPEAYEALQKLIKHKKVDRQYIALTCGQFAEMKGEIKTLFGRHLNNRTKFAVLSQGERKAHTKYQVQDIYAKANISLVEFTLQTGRTHQIRVHSEYIGHPIIGDKTYTQDRFKRHIPEEAKKFNRQALHSYKLGLNHPITNEELKFEVDLPNDMAKLVRQLKD